MDGTYVTIALRAAYKGQMKRLILCGALVLALVLAAGGSASAPSAKQIAAAHKRAAGQKAEKLLAKIPLPAGAQPTRTAPVFLTEQAWCEKNTSYACRMGFWRMRNPQAAVRRFMERHAPPGYANDGMDDFVGRSSFYDTLSARQHGWTFVRIDAKAVWFYPRSAREVVPSAVREIHIHGTGIDRTVTNAGDVKRIIGWFDRLRIVTPGLVCGPTSGTGFQPPPPLTFSFRTAGNAEVASAVVPAGPASDCDPIGFAIGGKSQRPLKDFGGGWSASERSAFITKVRHLLGGPKPKAEAEAQRLLDAYLPPLGAVRIQAAPKGSHLSRRIPGNLFGKRVDRHSYWLVHAPVRAIEKSFQDAKLPDWGTPAITSFAAKHGLASTAATYTALGFGGRATARLLNVTAVKAHGGGSLVRVDVVVVWRLSRAERQELPAGVRGIEIRGPSPGSALANVTDPGQVRTIVRWFDHLELYEPQFAAYCPAMLDRQSFTFTFQGRHGKIATANVPEVSGICSAASYAIRGHEQSSLIAGGFDYRVQQLLGANWIGPPQMQPRADERRRAAAREAAVLLHAFRPPPGAVRIQQPTQYGGVLRSAPAPAGEFVRLTRFWHVDAKRTAVVSFLQKHDVPAGFTAHCGANIHFGSSQCELVGDPVGTRFLEYAVQKKRDGTSILRVDSQVVWIYPRPREVVPASAREIVVNGPSFPAVHVTDAAQVRQIARWFDHLPIYPPGVGALMCGVTLGDSVTLTFRSAGGARVASARVPAGRASMCDSIAFSIHGNPQTALVDRPRGASFASRLERLLGVKLN
jgi:hypothetical protein